MTYNPQKDNDFKMSDIKPLQVTCKAFAASMVFSNELSIQKLWMHFLACLFYLRDTVYHITYE